MIKKYILDLKREFSGYNGKKLSQDVMAGLTVAAVALPLALAFGVSSGADAASGLITAIIAGIFSGLLSGASYQISGPTGAMSAILLPLAAKYGIQGVLIAGLLSGILLLILAFLKIGKLVSYIPVPVIMGFTSGIAIIIALGQIDNFFGTVSEGTSAIEKLLSYGRLGFHPNLWAAGFGALAMLVMIVYPKKLSAYFPSSLAAIIAAVILNFILNPNAAESTVTEVGSIPQNLMTSHSLILTGIDFSKIKEFIMPAFSIAALGMIESLLCGASAGKMKGEKLDSTRELLAQGIGNILIPLFGGVPSTAAIARTSVVIKSGGQTRLAGVFHSVTLILSMFLLGGIMSRIPLSALAGVLMVTAFRMNDWSAMKRLFGNRLRYSIVQFVVTMAATVIFDLTIAIVIGVVLAMMLFVLKNCDLKVALSDVDDNKLTDCEDGIHKNIKIVYLTGPLFFGTQEQLTNALAELKNLRGIIFSMRGVPNIDDSAIVEMRTLLRDFRSDGVEVLFCGVQPKVMGALERAGFAQEVGADFFHWDAVSAIKRIDEQGK